jgi:hypothetical protein
VLHVHRMEETIAGRPDLIGYWVSSGLSRALDPGWSVGWLLFGRVPSGHHRVRREHLTRARPGGPPRAGEAGAREPRRPLPPTLSAAAAADLPPPRAEG